MITKYVLYSTPACPNCQLIKGELEKTELKGEIVNAAMPDGLKKAQADGVMSVPTVKLFDDNDKEVATVTSLGDLRKAMENKSLTEH